MISNRLIITLESNNPKIVRIYHETAATDNKIVNKKYKQKGRRNFLQKIYWLEIFLIYF